MWDGGRQDTCCRRWVPQRCLCILFFVHWFNHLFTYSAHVYWAPTVCQVSRQSSGNMALKASHCLSELVQAENPEPIARDRSIPSVPATAKCLSGGSSTWEQRFSGFPNRFPVLPPTKTSRFARRTSQRPPERGQEPWARPSTALHSSVVLLKPRVGRLAPLQNGLVQMCYRGSGHAGLGVSGAPETAAHL